MPLLLYSVRYVVDELWVNPDLLGWTHSYTEDEAAITLKLPVDAADFTARDFETGLTPIPSVTIAATYNEPGFSSRTAAVQLFVVEAVFEAPLDGDRPEQISDGHPYWLQARQACNTGQPLCDRAAHEFLSWLRASANQPWLGLLAEPPRQYGRAGLRYADGGEVMGNGPEWKKLLQSPRLRLERTDLAAVGVMMSDHLVVPVAAELLSDALYLDEGSRTPDLRRAVITAAIACEVRVDEVIKERVSPDRAKLTAMMMKRTSNVAFILDEVLEAACGLSLRVSDPELWGRVDRLRSQRNAVVHAGAEVDAAVLNYRPARIGVDLFRWLDVNVPIG